MLYRGADLIRDIEYVVFDEVHYVNDTERGVVWEEVIIMLPSYVNLVFLSATTPNTLEFSDWIGRTKRKPVYVIKTDYRPVPLSYHLWAGLKLHKILEGNGPFSEKGYKDAANALLPSSVKDPNKKKNEPKGRGPTGSKQLSWQAQGSKQNWMSLVRYLDRELLTPTVVFSFSKKKCEEIAHMLQSLDLNTTKERSAVQGFTIQAVARLSENDAKLPQVQLICEMVRRGIGVHHGGLLPILKEMVEILFSRNLIKVLFATETFAMVRLAVDRSWCTRRRTCQSNSQSVACYVRASTCRHVLSSSTVLASMTAISFAIWNLVS
jgi:antiviral helicase SKI2